MSENTSRPVAVWRKRGDALHTMECSNCGADAHYQIVDRVWRYEPYCAHCGARVYKQEDLPMNENKKPRLAEVLGVEVEEKFNIRGHYYNPYFVDNEGVLIDGRCFAVDTVLSDMINHPELIDRRPHWTEQEVEDAKNIIRLLGANSYCCVTREINGELYLLKHQAHFDMSLPEYIFPSLKCCETVMLTDIIGGNE